MTNTAPQPAWDHSRAQVTYFATNRGRAQRTVTLEQAVSMMQQAAWHPKDTLAQYIAQQTNEVRAAKLKKHRDAKKDQAYAITLNGSIPQGKPRKSQHFKPNGLVTVELDHVGDLAHTTAELKHFASIPGLVIAAVSISGTGIFAVFAADPTPDEHNYRHAWEAACQVIPQHLQTLIDTGPKDLTRLRYLATITADAVINFNAEPITWQPHASQPPKKVHQSVPHSAGEVDRLLNQIDCKERDYDEWLAIMFAYKIEGGTWAVWDKWCQTDPDRYDREYNLKKWEQEPKGAVTIRTLQWYANKHNPRPDPRSKVTPIRRDLDLPQVEVDDVEPVQEQLVLDNTEPASPAVWELLDCCHNTRLIRDVCIANKVSPMAALGAVMARIASHRAVLLPGPPSIGNWSLMIVLVAHSGGRKSAAAAQASYLTTDLNITPILPGSKEGLHDYFLHYEDEAGYIRNKTEGIFVGAGENLLKEQNPHDTAMVRGLRSIWSNEELPAKILARDRERPALTNIVAGMVINTTWDELGMLADDSGTIQRITFIDANRRPYQHHEIPDIKRYLLAQGKSRLKLAKIEGITGTKGERLAEIPAAVRAEVEAINDRIEAEAEAQPLTPHLGSQTGIKRLKHAAVLTYMMHDPDNGPWAPQVTEDAWRLVAPFITGHDQCLTKRSQILNHRQQQHWQHEGIKAETIEHVKETTRQARHRPRTKDEAVQRTLTKVLKKVSAGKKLTKSLCQQSIQHDPELYAKLGTSRADIAQETLRQARAQS